jgi:hypothetical protein
VITNISSQIAVDVDPAEFQLQDWSRYRAVLTRLKPDRDAHSEVTRNINFTLIQQGSDISVGTVTIKVALDQPKSWVQSKQSNLLLEHEQGHFYITYIDSVVTMATDILSINQPAATVNPRGLALTDPSVKPAFTAPIQQKRAASAARINAFNNQYDDKPPGGTDHGRDQTAQTRWTQRFWQSLTWGQAL